MIRTSGRLAVTLGFIAASVVWIAHGLQLLPDVKKPELEGRLKLCESIALTTTIFAERGNITGLKSFLEQIQARNPGIQSMGVRRNNRLVAWVGDHKTNWQAQPGTNEAESTPTEMIVGILANGLQWGQVEIKFGPLASASVQGIFAYPALLVIFSGSMVALLSWFFLSRSLKYLNPSKVVPSRVRLALDSLAEGLILMDADQQIVLANESFSEMVGKTADELMGGSPDQFPWKTDDQAELPRPPWDACFEQTKPIRGTMMTLGDEQQSPRKFIVNTTPIVESNGHCKGVLASFDDVTLLEDKRMEMRRMLEILRASRDEIGRQNDHLQYLASRDPLTGCFNRRSFFERLNQMWESEECEQISVIMIDIDHFKSINDNYGHSVGDLVIKGAAAFILEQVGESGVTCRYGGEEFCIAVFDTEFETVVELARSIRSNIELKSFEGVSFTFSIGVSARQFGSMDPQHLLEQADQCLYAAKNNGRNRVVRWDECDKEDLHVDPDVLKDYGDTLSIIDPIQHYSSIAALYTALYYRDAPTALHSARVANLARHVAERLSVESVCKVVEVAGLFHDIGKIGIPDNILRKPTQLSDSQMELMHHRHEIGEAISKSAAVSPDVAEIVRNYRIPFDDGRGYVELNQARPRIALACRILAVCDAFDSMVHEAQYRNAKSPKDAIQELKKCAPAQFDPELVEELTELLEEQPTAFLPLRVEGVFIDNSESPPEIDVVAAAHLGDTGPLRAMMKRLKRDSLSESPEIQQVVEQLDDSLSRNDEELKRLIETTQEIMELCQQNRMKSDTEYMRNLFRS